MLKSNKDSKETQSPVCQMFLSRLAEGKTSVTVFLICGVRLQGIITHFDEDSILLKREGHTQLVFRHSISTIMPVDPVQIDTDD